MALRARLTAPPPPPIGNWPWHHAKWASLSTSLLRDGDRRMEADSYLSSGYGLRTAIQSKPSGWTLLSELANAWMPGRLGGILVGKEFGTPYLAATQAFDTIPTPRKWLAIEKTSDAETRFVKPGQILVTCSGAVGRTIIAYAVHENTLISDDLIRVNPVKREYGWLYAYLRSPQVLAMSTSAKYGHVIKHLEPAHLQHLPVPLVDDKTAAKFTRDALEILRLRSESYRLTGEANQIFADAVGSANTKDKVEGFTARASAMASGRRRLEGSYHNPLAAAIFRRFKKWEPLSAVTERVWWMSRFKRNYGDGGLPYLSADELFTVNPIESKRILVRSDDSHENYFVERGWIVMACSDQIYGLNGAASLMTEHHEKTFMSHDLIRIVVDKKKVRPGYVLIALTHPTHGRPLLIRAAYGTSIPHLDPGDVADFPVVRLDSKVENRIADLAEESAKARADADALDRRVSMAASEVIDDFIASKPIVEAQRDTQQLARRILDTIAP